LAESLLLTTSAQLSSVNAHLLLILLLTHVAQHTRRSQLLLKTLKADVFLAPHAEQFGLEAKRERLKSGSTNPFVDPGELARRVAESEADFLKTLARQEASAK